MNATWYYMHNRCVCDISEYRFYCGNELIGTAGAHIVPAHPFVLSCGDLSLRCRRDPDMTLVPGISIPITDAATGAEYARIYWEGQGRHRLHTPFGMIQVHYRSGRYTFSRSDNCFAFYDPIEDDPEYPAELEDGWKIRRSLITRGPLPRELAVLMLFFPLLAIGP